MISVQNPPIVRTGFYELPRSMRRRSLSGTYRARAVRSNGARIPRLAVGSGRRPDFHHPQPACDDVERTLGKQLAGKLLQASE